MTTVRNLRKPDAELLTPPGLDDGIIGTPPAGADYWAKLRLWAQTIIGTQRGPAGYVLTANGPLEADPAATFQPSGGGGGGYRPTREIHVDSEATPEAGFIFATLEQALTFVCGEADRYVIYLHGDAFNIDGPGAGAPYELPLTGSKQLFIKAAGVYALMVANVPIRNSSGFSVSIAAEGIDLYAGPGNPPIFEQAIGSAISFEMQGGRLGGYTGGLAKVPIAAIALWDARAQTGIDLQSAATTVYLNTLQQVALVNDGSATVFYREAIGADPTTDDSLITKRYGDLNYGGGGEDYTPAVPADWEGTPPPNFTQALDRLAAAWNILTGLPVPEIGG